jgi:hippurate hydrolase
MIRRAAAARPWRSFSSVAPDRHTRERLLRLAVCGALVSAPAVARAQPAASIERLLPAAKTLYLDLHQHPELSLHEVETSAKIAARLGALGYQVTTGVGGHGVVALLKNGAGPVVMLRTELDALPIAEQTGLPYASTVTSRDDSGAVVPVMHACGHDLHMAALVATADWMAGSRTQWHGTLLLIAQPAEERIVGAEAMMKDGLYTRFPKPEYAIAVHDTEGLPAGTAGYTPGFSFTSADSVDIVIHGRGGHGSSPQRAVDPVVIAARTILALQTIVSREVRPGEHAVITVGNVQAGTKNNIIPDDVTLRLTVRAYKPEVRQQLLDAIERVAKGEAIAGNAPREPDVTIVESTPALYNDPELTVRLAKALERSLGAANVRKLDPDFPSEDFSRFLVDGVKGSLIRIGATRRSAFDAAQKSGETLPGLHNARFAPDVEPALRTAISAEVSSLIELMGTPTGR